MSPTVNCQEAVDIFRRCGFQMTTEKLKAGITTGTFPFGSVIEMNHTEFLISRLKLYEYIADFGGVIPELTEYVTYLRENGWQTSKEVIDHVPCA